MIFPRWLLSKGKDGEVEKIYHKMARMNGLQISTEAFGIFKELNVAKVETVRSVFIFYRLLLAHTRVRLGQYQNLVRSMRLCAINCNDKDK